MAELLEHDRTVGIPVPHLPPENRPALVRAILGLEPSLAVRVEDRTGGNPLFAVQQIGDWVLRGAVEAGPDGFRLRLDEELPADAHAMWAARIERLLAERTRRRPTRWSWRRSSASTLTRWSGERPVPGARAPTRAQPSWTASSTSGWPGVDREARSKGGASPTGRCGRASSRGRDAVGGWSAGIGPAPRCFRGPASTGGRGRSPSGSVATGSGRTSRRWRSSRSTPGRFERVATGDFAVAEALLDLEESAFERMAVPNSDPRWGEAWLLRHEIALPPGPVRRHRAVARPDRGRRDAVRLGADPEPGPVPVWPAGLDQGRYASALGWLADVEKDSARRGDRHLMAESRLEIGRALLGSADIAGATKWIRLAQLDYQGLGDALGTAEAWQALGEVAKEAGQHADASTLLRRAESLFEEGGHRWKMAAAINSQGDVARSTGDLDLAATLYRRARGLLKAIGSQAWVFPEYNTGLVYLARGDQKRAQGMLEVAMGVFTEQGNSSALANAHLALALCSALDGSSGSCGTTTSARPSACSTRPGSATRTRPASRPRPEQPRRGTIGSAGPRCVRPRGPPVDRTRPEAGDRQCRARPRGVGGTVRRGVAVSLGPQRSSSCTKPKSRFPRRAPPTGTR